MGNSSCDHNNTKFWRPLKCPAYSHAQHFGLLWPAPLQLGASQKGAIWRIAWHQPCQHSAATPQHQEPKPKACGAPVHPRHGHLAPLIKRSAERTWNLQWSGNIFEHDSFFRGTFLLPRLVIAASPVTMSFRHQLPSPPLCQHYQP